jgi:prolyl-tRNA editing enzyme YbaK/EbsC (Cys-tRNA(Pro) deacylase)
MISLKKETNMLGYSICQILDDFGVDYIVRKNQGNEAFACEDVARERSVALSQVLKCMVGKATFFLDETVTREEYIDISSGSPDAGIELKACDLIELIKPTICVIVSESEGA